MLVLGIRDGGRVLLDNGVIISFFGSPEGRRVAIEAPGSVRIYREEVLAPERVREIEGLARGGRTKRGA